MFLDGQKKLGSDKDILLAVTGQMFVVSAPHNLFKVCGEYFRKILCAISKVSP